MWKDKTLAMILVPLRNGLSWAAKGKGNEK